MRKLIGLAAVGIFWMAGFAYATDRQTSADFFKICSTGTLINVSTSAWTAVPSTGAICPDRLATIINNYSNNLDSFILTVTSTTEPPATIRQGEGEIQPGEVQIWSIEGSSGTRNNLRNPLYLWAVSMATGTEQLFVKEVK